MDNQKQKSIILVVRKWEKILFEGEVRSFSSYNSLGVFDILGKHANFISIIKKNCIIRNLDGTVNEIKIEEGLVKVRENKVTVYLGMIG